MSKKSNQDNSIDLDIIDDLIKDCKTQEDLFGKGGIFKQIQKAILERALEGEMTTELGYSRHDSAGDNSGNSRNGHSKKTIRSGSGEFPIQVPRDRNGDFAPKIILYLLLCVVQFGALLKVTKRDGIGRI